MKRLLRRASNLSAAVSAVLLVGVCVLWVRSFTYDDYAFYHLDSRHWWRFLSARGGIAASRYRLVVLTPAPPLPAGPDPGWAFDSHRHDDSWMIPQSGSRFGQLWFEPATGKTQIFSRLGTAVEEYQGVVVPYWPILAALATGLLIPLFQRLRRGGSRAGLCPACGYDLRATPERCPECGAVPGAEKTDQAQGVRWEGADHAV